MTAKEFLSVAEAAERIGVSRDIAYRMLRTEGLPWLHMNGRIKVPARALDQWLQERASEALSRKETNE